MKGSCAAAAPELGNVMVPRVPLRRQERGAHADERGEMEHSE
jgi:hypothetical protein